MPGRIVQNDIEQVKARASILDVVGEYVTLKRAGADSYKGLSPFKEERTPSFHVRPHAGLYHCFSTGKGGDVYSFIQEMENISFVEAVERLAGRIGYELHYEESTPQQEEDRGRRTRILAANLAASEFFQAQLALPGAETARAFLAERAFDQAAAAHFGVGFSPRSRDALSSALIAKGFTPAELLAAGLTGQGDRGGSYDRFRGRLMWPIRDVTGQTVGFGARKLFDDDQSPKYLNTPDTTVYHKSQVLYGLDLARRDIGKLRQVVVVEGYTDVMACHLAGVTTAVATCGTAFGSEHITVIRRVLGDDTAGRGEIVFTFDPDAAGQKAAMRAFAEEQRFTAQTYVAVGADGLDPCDLRLERGDHAVRQLLAEKRPMFEFAIKQLLAQHDLETVEGRVAALRAAAPVIAGIRDQALRPGYIRELAGWLGGTDPREVAAAVDAAARSGKPADTSRGRREAAGRSAGGGGQAGGGEPSGGGPGGTSSDGAPGDLTQERPLGIAQLPADPLTRLERDALMAVLQHPAQVGAPRILQLAGVRFANPSLSVIRDAVVVAVERIDDPSWLMTVAEEVPAPFQTLVKELGMATLPTVKEETLPLYLQGVTGSLIERELLRRKAELLGALQRTDSAADPQRYRELSAELQQLEQERRAIRHD